MTNIGIGLRGCYGRKLHLAFFLTRVRDTFCAALSLRAQESERNPLAKPSGSFASCFLVPTENDSRN